MSININDSTPAAPAGSQNLKWQKDGSGNVSGYVTPTESVNAQTGTTYTIAAGDRAALITFSNASSVAVTLPQAGGSFPSGWFADLWNLGAGTVTITPTTSTIHGASTYTLTTDQGVRIVSDGTNYKIAFSSGTASGSGSVTSVALTVPSFLSVSGSPVTTSGTLAVTAATGQTANQVLATPNGSTGAASLRGLVAADIPNLDAGKIATGTMATARLGSGTADNTTFLRGDNTWAAPSGSGSVTSVALTAPSWLSVSGSPITGSGTLAVSATTGQTANQFLATPNGSSGAVGLRAIAAADLPLATTGAFGAVKPDGTTITISSGVISASGGSSGAAPGQQSITPPPSSGWTADNVNSGGSFDFSSGPSGSYGYMHNVANSANTLQGYYRTAPSAPYSATIFVRQAWGLTNGAGMALAFGWRDSSGKLEVVRISWDSGSGSWQTYIDKWASSTSYNSTATSVNGGVITQALWMSLFSGLWLHWTDDNTNLQWYFGVNGLDWIPLLTSQGRTSYLSSPSEIYLGQIANVADGYLQLVSYTD